MSERWQQWMPFHIDRFRGSPDVQAMHPVARCGYIYLLTAQWQSSTCTLPRDSEDLSALSGLGDELWEKYGPKILRKFGTDAQGNICNLVLIEEWKEAKRIFEARQASAHRTNTVRSPSRSTSRPADTITLTGTSTLTETKTNTLALTSDDVPAENPKKRTKTSEAKTRHSSFKAALESYWKSKNGVVEMPWGPAEGRNLEMWLRESPNTTIEQFTGFLRNRFRSDVNHSERPSRWIGNITNFASGPIDKYGKPKETQSHPLSPRIDVIAEIRARNAAAQAEVEAAHG